MTVAENGRQRRSQSRLSLRRSIRLRHTRAAPLLDDHFEQPYGQDHASEDGRIMIRVVLPAHLRTLARIDGEVTFDIEGKVTQRSVLDALEARYPMLRGTIRDHVTQKRRPFIRFFTCEQDLSHESPDAPLPDAVATGAEPFLIVGAMAGG